MKNHKGTILSLFDYTGNMVDPWAKDGYLCICVDIRHPKGLTIKENGVNCLHADLYDYWLPPRRIDYYAVFAFPPCTNLAVSGSGWFKQKGLKGLIKGLELVEKAKQICQWAGARWMIENPVSTLSSYWRKPDHIFDPFEYAEEEEERYCKKTCLWTSKDFIMPASNGNTPKIWGVYNGVDSYSKMHVSVRSPEDRVSTPKGFAKAVWEVNKRKDSCPINSLPNL